MIWLQPQPLSSQTLQSLIMKYGHFIVCFLHCVPLYFLNSSNIINRSGLGRFNILQSSSLCVFFFQTAGASSSSSYPQLIEKRISKGAHFGPQRLKVFSRLKGWSGFQHGAHTQKKTCMHRTSGFLDLTSYIWQWRWTYWIGSGVEVNKHSMSLLWKMNRTKNCFTPKEKSHACFICCCCR